MLEIVLLSTKSLKREVVSWSLILVICIFVSCCHCCCWAARSLKRTNSNDEELFVAANPSWKEDNPMLVPFSLMFWKIISDCSRYRTIGWPLNIFNCLVEGVQEIIYFNFAPSPTWTYTLLQILKRNLASFRMKFMKCMHFRSSKVSSFHR